MQYHASSYAEDVWDIFWYEKNLQGDIVAIYNEAGAKLVTYTYDAWGSFSRTYHNDGQNTAAANNPFTYRGYYYDYDLKFYYLNSRYYDPYVGRFINSDSLIAGNSGSIHGHNLFVYCFNNPANMTDSEGNWGESIKEWLIDKANTLYYNATKWHFEDRIEANGEHPTHEEVNETNSDWRLLPKSESLYHIDDVGKDELKYVHPDGREAVFNGDTLEPMTDPRYMGTYNYVTIQELPENAEYRDYIAVAGSYVGHFFADVLPYYLTLKSNTREQFEEKIIAIFD